MPHTPGPYEVTDAGCQVCDSKGTGIATLRVIHEPGGKSIMQANARLIATAPEMLELLLKIGDSLASCDPDEWPTSFVMQIQQDIKRVTEQAAGRIE